MIIDTSHQINDKKLLKYYQTKNICSEYMVVSDPILFDELTRLLKIIYNLDRGNVLEQKFVNIFDQIDGFKLLNIYNFFTFPLIYKHAIFLIKINE